MSNWLCPFSATRRRHASRHSDYPSLEKIRLGELNVTRWNQFLLLLFGVLANGLISQQLLNGQDIGGTSLAGMQWEDNFRVRNGWYNSNFGAVVFDGDNDGHDEVWLLGGLSNGYPPEALTSQNYSGAGSPVGFHWTPRVEAPWSKRSDFEAVVYQDKIWVFAGKETTVSDVWFATKGLVGDPQSEMTMGLNWTRAADAPWPVRGGYEAEVFDGKIWLMGGYNGTNFLNDVWSFDGTTWHQEANAPWPGRDGFASVVHNGELYIIGGRSNDGTVDYVLSDVWKTSDGISWTQVTANMNIGPIREHASVVFDNRIWIIGGNISTDDLLYDPTERVSHTDEVWYSTEGESWDIASAYGDAPFARLQGHEVVVVDEFYQNRKDIPHSQFQAFPRMLFTGGRLANLFANGYVFVDRRDHEFIPYTSPTAASTTIQSPKGRQTDRTTSSSIEFSEDILISDVNLRLDMSHPSWSEITEMALILETTDDDGSPRTRRFPFMWGGPSNWSGRFNSILTDEGGQPFGTNTPDWYEFDPQPRQYAMKAGDYLRWFDGFTAKGTWTLEITDSVKGNDGILHGWSLEIRGMPLAADPGISVSPNQGLLTTEAGGSDTFDIVLDSEPAADVTIGISSSDTTEGTVDKTSLTFTAADWDLPQTVTVTGVDDAIEDGNVAYTINTAAAMSTDPNYNGLDADDVGVTNLDDEQAPTVTYDSDVTQNDVDIPDQGTATSTDHGS